MMVWKVVLMRNFSSDYVDDGKEITTDIRKKKKLPYSGHCKCNCYEFDAVSYSRRTLPLPQIKAANAPVWDGCDRRGARGSGNSRVHQCVDFEQLYLTNGRIQSVN